jgi:hypothetical protein
MQMKLGGDTDRQTLRRMTLAFFCLGSLSLLGQLESAVSEKDRREWIDWIYAQQVLPDPEDPDKSRYSCGFKGSSWAGHSYDPQAVRKSCQDNAHKCMPFFFSFPIYSLSAHDIRRQVRNMIRTTPLAFQIPTPH